MTASTTLIACSHGTRSARAAGLVTAAVEAVAAKLPGTRVIEMFVDVQQPELAGALPGVTGPVVVLPLFLSRGYHVHHDIRAAVAAHRHAVLTAPLGPDPVLADLQLSRLRQAGMRGGAAVVLAASASSDQRAVRDVSRAARLLEHRLGTEVTVGVVGGAGVPVEEAVAAARRRSGRVAVSSYLLMPGYFHAQVAAARADVTSEPLLAGPTPDDLVNLILQRYTTSIDQAA